MNLTLLRIPENEVVYEEHPDEMIFLHLRDGLYYALSRPGADCAAALLGAATLGEAMSWLQQHFGAEEAALRQYCEKLVQDLTAERLVCPRGDGEPGEGELAGHGEDRAELAPYRLERFEDIQDILKFDPVHEVSEDGWPSVIDK